MATQTLEVGADLDFDGLVTECASLDAVRQRFGRLNRMGRPIDARAVILVRGDQSDATADESQTPKKTGENDDPVYGFALTETWTWLNRHKNERDEVDFGIVSLDRLLPEGDSLAALNAPSRDAAVMLPAHIDCWAQTAPAPSPSPDVALFLHGPRESAADVQVCWRADLDLIHDREGALETLSLCPPSSGETLPVPIGVFRRWLAGEAVEDDSADVEGIVTEEASNRSGAPVVQWRGAETDEDNITDDPRKIRPGDVIVVPTSHPYETRRLGDVPSDAVLDIGDEAYRRARARPILRLHPALVRAWPDSIGAKTVASELLKNLEQKYDNDPHEVGDTLWNLLTELAASEPPTERWAWLTEAAKELSDEYGEHRDSMPDRAYRVVGDESIVLIGHHRLNHLAYMKPTASATRMTPPHPASHTVMDNLSGSTSIFPESKRSLAAMRWVADCRMIWSKPWRARGCCTTWARPTDAFSPCCEAAPHGLMACFSQNPRECRRPARPGVVRTPSPVIRRVAATNCSRCVWPKPLRRSCPRATNSATWFFIWLPATTATAGRSLRWWLIPRA